MKKFTELQTADTIRAFHTAQANFWQNQAASEHALGIKPSEARFRTYWQTMSADSYRRARYHVRKMLELICKPHRWPNVSGCWINGEISDNGTIVSMGNWQQWENGQLLTYINPPIMEPQPLQLKPGTLQIVLPDLSNCSVTCDG